MLCYLFRDTFNIKETRPPFCEYNNISVSANYLDQFNQVLRNLLDGKRIQAAAGGSLRKFAVEMQQHQTSTHYFHLCNAHLIYLSKIAMIAWLRLLEIFRNVVAESKEGDFIHPAVILFFRSTPSMTPHIRH